MSCYYGNDGQLLVCVGSVEAWAMMMSVCEALNSVLWRWRRPWALLLLTRLAQDFRGTNFGRDEWCDWIFAEILFCSCEHVWQKECFPLLPPICLFFAACFSCLLASLLASPRPPAGLLLWYRCFGLLLLSTTCYSIEGLAGVTKKSTRSYDSRRRIGWVSCGIVGIGKRLSTEL